MTTNKSKFTKFYIRRTLYLRRVNSAVLLILHKKNQSSYLVSVSTLILKHMRCNAIADNCCLTTKFFIHLIPTVLFSIFM